LTGEKFPNVSSWGEQLVGRKFDLAGLKPKDVASCWHHKDKPSLRQAMYLTTSSLWSFNTRDLMRASSCDHCTKISIARTLGIQEVLGKLQPYEDKIAEDKANGEDQSLAQKYGVIFEDALINELLESVGKDVVGRPETDGDMNQTIELMKAGVPVIYQGGLKRTFERTLFSGRPDFLVHQGWELVFVENKLTAQRRAESVGSPRENKYTVWDAKYGGQAKPAYLLQVGLYVDALDALGLKAEGERHGLVLGSRTTDSFEEIEIVPAMRLARKKISDLIYFAEQAKNEDKLHEFAASNLAWHCT